MAANDPGWAAYKDVADSSISPLNWDRMHAADVDAQQSALQSPLKTAAMSLDNQGKQLSNDEAQTTLDESRKNQPVRDIARANQLIAEAIAHIDPNSPTAAQDYDKALDTAAANGAGAAALQWKGYSPAKLARLAASYSAGTPLGAQQAMSSDSPLAALGGGGGGPAGADHPAMTSPVASQEQIQSYMATHPPAVQQQLFTHMAAVNAAARRVMDSPNPQAAWAMEAQQLGFDPAQYPYTPLRVADVIQSTQPWVNAGQQAASGVPTMPPPADIQNVGGVMYNVNKTDPSNPTVTALTQPSGTIQPVGTDAQGHLIYLNNRTGAETTGGIAGVQAKPGTGSGGGKTSVYESKRQAWLALHPDDYSGALQYASGKGAMTSAQARQAADAQASKDVNARAMAGEQIDNPGQAIKDRAAEIYGDLTSASTAPLASTPQGAASTTANRSDLTGTAATTAQRKTAAQYHGASAAVGDPKNPYVPTTQQQFDRLPAGAVFIGKDGQLHRKPRR